MMKRLKNLFIVFCMLLFGMLLFGTEYSFKNVNVSEYVGSFSQEKVYVGGTPLGMELYGKNPVIVGKTEVITEYGFKNPIKDSNIKIGDSILKLENVPIVNASDLKNVLREVCKNKDTIEIELMRNGKLIKTKISPAIDSETKEYRLGVYVRDSVSGIGTLTFVREDGRFGALGHPVCAYNSKMPMEISGGRIEKCSILGITKGQSGVAGELKGIFIKDGELKGKITKNMFVGVYGKFDTKYKNELFDNPVEIMSRHKIKTGKAQLVTTVNGFEPKIYDVEIIKTSYQKNVSEKGLVIKITDEELLQKTGGIVQGMSGSPIIQDGKLVGAVTHVFVNDATRGYGVYADWMIKM